MDLIRRFDPQTDRVTTNDGRTIERYYKNHLDVPFVLDGRSLAHGDHFTFSTVAGSVDCLLTPAGTRGYEDLRVAAELIDLGDTEVWVASVDDLIRMKRAAGRPKDRVELEILGALRDEIDGT